MRKILAALLFAAIAPLAMGQQSTTTQGAATAGATGTGTSQAASMNAGNGNGAQLSITSNGGGHSQVVATPSIQGNGFYGSVSPDGCTVSQGGGAAGWLVGMSFVGAHDAMFCYTLRTYERTMQWAVNLPSEQQVFAWMHPVSPDGKAPAPTPYLYQGPTREEGMATATDELCLMGDRIKATMEAHGLCKAVAQIPTYDHTGWDSDSRAFDRKFAAEHNQQ